MADSHSNSPLLGLDIGGANIKYDDLNGRRGQFAFEMWKQPRELPRVLQQGIDGWSNYRRLAVTMTGELADCFPDRRHGVAQICDAISTAQPVGEVLFYQTTGEFVPAPAAKSEWVLTAASNWHALASWIARSIEDCLVIDIGSTTTDVIPVRTGRPVAIGRTDWQRMQNHELVYTGVIRSPVVAVLPRFQCDHGAICLAQENFATMLDVHLILGHLLETDDCQHTADGRRANRSAAYRRLARMICSDATDVSQDVLQDIAKQAHRQQVCLVAEAIRRVADRSGVRDPLVVCGEGAWLASAVAEDLFDQPRILDESSPFLPQTLVDSLSTAAAVAQLARVYLNGAV